MEIIPYQEEHIIFREGFRRFLAKEIVPHVEEWEEDGIVPRWAWKKLGEQGYLCTSVPARYGGQEADFLFSAILIEEMARANFYGLSARLHSDVVVPYIVQFATEGQKKKYLPGCVSGDIITAIAMSEPQAGSDVAGIKTTATADGDYFIINGQKTFISNGINCDLVIVAAKDPKEINPHAAVDLFLVEAGTPGFQKGKKLKKIGWRSQDTAELFFTDCRIPKENRLGEKGTGFKKLMTNLQQERLICTLGAQTAAEFMLEETIRYCRQREVFGKTLGAYQNTQFALAEMAAEVRIGRNFIDRLTVEHWRKETVVTDVSMAKFWITEMAYRVADRCLQLFGGYGYCEEYPIARAWRDIRVTRILAGSNEIMKMIVGREITK
ncbi:MAG TPA: acyl-CoA dehydrogenase family protein [Smithellaceae bacterium]|nr:acyl-CoA dehydrogenase family protein [Smithellaceae bacterium]HRS88096.1 acyl-CoA dehydrogenase family protein [Smithellaceae bacterium]HRV25430.1 acyl-CoA dehydrogenase family protein [Smithellaceae bacterium]